MGRQEEVGARAVKARVVKARAMKARAMKARVMKARVMKARAMKARVMKARAMKVRAMTSQVADQAVHHLQCLARTNSKPPGSYSNRRRHAGLCPSACVHRSANPACDILSSEYPVSLGSSIRTLVGDIQTAGAVQGTAASQDQSDRCGNRSDFSPGPL